MKRSWRYRHRSTSTLRAFVAVLSKPGLAWLFNEQIVEMQNELLARELASIAEDVGGHACVTVGDWQ